jgi:hypothetical protein
MVVPSFEVTEAVMDWLATIAVERSVTRVLDFIC